MQDRVLSIRARLNKGRQDVDGLFADLRERAENSVMPLISRDAELAAMLSRISRIKSPDVRYDQAHGVELVNGLPRHIPKTENTVV